MKKEKASVKMSLKEEQRRRRKLKENNEKLPVLHPICNMCSLALYGSSLRENCGGENVAKEKSYRNLPGEEPKAALLLCLYAVSLLVRARSSLALLSLTKKKRKYRKAIAAKPRTPYDGG